MAMTKAQEREMTDLRNAHQRHTRRYSQLASEKNTADRLVEMLFDKLGLDDDHRDEMRRQAKEE